jgi:uncharacterized protein (DUF1810 family)
VATGSDSDPFDLARFVRAQSSCHDDVVAELRAGAKRTHWMWFVFPQLAGLGESEMARRYAVSSLAEARAYAAHSVLGTRLREAVRLLLALPPGHSAQDVFGWPDVAKLRSCLTLFARAVPGEPLFDQALDRFYRGEPDPQTLHRL